MTKAVLLDVDGTLIDSNHAHTCAWVEALAEAGHVVQYQAVRERISMGGDHLLPSLLGIDDEAPEGEKLSRRRGEIFREKYLKTLKPFPGTRQMIERILSAGLKPVVATSSPEKDLGGLLKQAGVEDLLTRKTSSDDAESSKPDPDIIQAALKKAGVAAQEAVMIGDTPYDIEAAAKAGVKCIAFTCGGWPAEKLQGAVAVYEGPESLTREFERSPLVGP